MTQEERWQKRYEEVVGFIKTNHRNPSKHRIEEHDMLNWLKANRKVMNAGKMKAERAETALLQGSCVPLVASAAKRRALVWLAKPVP